MLEPTITEYDYTTVIAPCVWWCGVLAACMRFREAGGRCYFRSRALSFIIHNTIPGVYFTEMLRNIVPGVHYAVCCTHDQGSWYCCCSLSSILLLYSVCRMFSRGVFFIIIVNPMTPRPRPWAQQQQQQQSTNSSSSQQLPAAAAAATAA